MIIFSAIGTITNASSPAVLMRLTGLDYSNIALLTIVLSAIHFIYLTLYIITLVGLAKRMAFSVPWGRAALILTLFWIPAGTIAGGLMLRRINNPVVKKYLNHRAL